MRNFHIVVPAFFLAIGMIGSAHAGVDEGMQALKAKDYRKAHQEFLPSAKKGDAEAQFQLGLMYFAGNGVPKDQVIAADYLRDAAKQGHRKAQHQLAYMRSHLITVFGHIGEHTTPQELESLREAAHWYEELAKGGSTTAMRGLLKIMRWSKGKVGPADEYFPWLTRAAERGDNASQYEMSQRLMKGDGVKKDPKGAVKWLERAAFNGHASAARNLGLAYIRGTYGETRPEDGIGLLFKASAGGDPGADVALAESFAGGFVVSHNVKLAYLYLAKARSSGFIGKKSVERLASYLDRELAKARINPRNLLANSSLWQPEHKAQSKKMAQYYDAARKRHIARSK